MSEHPAPGAAPRIRLGGMALRNGLLIHGPTSWAAAARDSAGEIHVGSGPKPILAPELGARIPLLRGPLKLAEAFVLVPHVRRSLPAARLPFEDPRVLGAVVGVSVLGRVFRSARASSRLRGGSVTGELAQGILGLAPALTALSNRDLAAYHGAEHKAIGAYETGSDDPAAAPKEHDRCGSNLVAPMLLLSAAGQVLLDSVLENPGPLARSVVGIGSISLAAEMFGWSERHPDSALADAFHKPGHEIQRWVATAEPTPEQLEVSSAALAEILRVEQAAVAE